MCKNLISHYWSYTYSINNSKPSKFCKYKPWILSGLLVILFLWLHYMFLFTVHKQLNICTTYNLWNRNNCCWASWNSWILWRWSREVCWKKFFDSAGSDVVFISGTSSLIILRAFMFLILFCWQIPLTIAFYAVYKKKYWLYGEKYDNIKEKFKLNHW